MNPSTPHSPSFFIWLFLLTVVFSLLSFFYVDSGFTSYFALPRFESFWVFNREITNIGESLHFFLLSVFGLLASRFLLWKKLFPSYEKTWSWLWNWSKSFLVSLAASGILVQILKHLVGRQRPHKTDLFEHFHFKPLVAHWDWHSWPSGHSQTMFVAYFYFSLLFPRWRWPLFGVCAYLALTRTLTQAHFLSDILGGAFLGYVISALVYEKIGKKNPSFNSVPSQDS